MGRSPLRAEVGLWRVSIFRGSADSVADYWHASPQLTGRRAARATASFASLAGEADRRDARNVTTVCRLPLPAAVSNRVALRSCHYAAFSIADRIACCVREATAARGK